MRSENSSGAARIEKKYILIIIYTRAREIITH